MTMGKVQLIKSSRKVWKCQKCGEEIQKGDSYYRGEVNFGPTFIRCTKCKLHSWEVTGSDYLREAGRIINTWEDELDYSDPESFVENLVSDIESLRDDIQESLDNMPEGLQEGDIGVMLQDRIDGLDSAAEALEEIDFDELRQVAVDENYEIDDEADEDSEEDCLTYDDVVNSDTIDDSDKSSVVEAFESSVYDSISEAIEYIIFD